MADSFFAGVTVAPPIEVFSKNKMCMDCTAPHKINLTVGAYRTEKGQPWVLPVVRKAEKTLAADESLNHEYLPVLGLPAFCDAAVEFLLGKDAAPIKEGKAFGIQCLSGTGSLRMGAEFLHRVLGFTTVYVSDPTWGNHNLVFKNAGFTDIRKYRYWQASTRKLDIDGLLQDLENAAPKSVVLLHGCAHNPTGLDPTQEQWGKIADVIKKKGLFTFFDLAYQGFASGDPEKDAWSVRHFASQGLEMLVAQSFAKNFGLYNERVGNVTVIVRDVATIAAIKSQASLVIRANWSNPPSHGARIVHMVLTTPDLRKEWYGHIAEMSTRIRQMRQALRERLEALKTPGNWDHITTQIGMFSYLGLDAVQCQSLIDDHQVFLLSSGRINVCGINPGNVDRLAAAIHDVVGKAHAHI